VAALGRLFTKWHFIVVIAASVDVPRMARQELSGRDSPRYGGTRTADQMKVKADRINRRTTRLLRGQALLFIAGFLLVTAMVLLKDIDKIKG